MKLNPALPAKEHEQDNGLDFRTQDKVLRHPKEPVFVIAMLNCEQIIEDIDGGTREPKMRIVAVEVLESGPPAMQLLQQLKEARTGQAEIQHFEAEADEDGDSLFSLRLRETAAQVAREFNDDVAPRLTRTGRASE